MTAENEPAMKMGYSNKNLICGGLAFGGVDG
jgi:hypothetical protein